ncbi:hypothetical protein AVEN_230843-1 [Araneus ventricosus]|uniref:Uncharacterized protein n=1 Tax=Araneus ventricosus TaxID=182803 RepID=A0A4Y2A294_ARAVE|nr:hypothetical protein AVEN_230843-1 [Araneus ventricosus]
MRDPNLEIEARFFHNYGKKQNFGTTQSQAVKGLMDVKREGVIELDRRSESQSRVVAANVLRTLPKKYLDEGAGGGGERRLVVTSLYE